MTRLTIAAIAFAGLVLASTTGLRAEDYLDSGGWYEVEFAKYKPICARRANEITRDHFFEVDKKVGRRVLPFYVQTGQWDHIVAHPLVFTNEGYEWADYSEWWPTLVEQEGGEDQALALLAEYFECITTSHSELVRLVSGIPSAR